MCSTRRPQALADEVDYSRLSSFLKYCSDDDRVIKGIFEDHKIRFTQPRALNDPLEFRPIIKFRNARNYQWFRYDGLDFPSEEWWVRFNLIEQRIDRFGILSLTKVWDSFDMWSRYANGHKGFLLCLKSDFNEQACMRSAASEVYPVQGIDYVDEYAIDMEEVVDDRGNLRKGLVDEQLFFRKVSRWQAEKEYRMVRPFSDLPGYTPPIDWRHRDDDVHLFDFSLDCVEGVVFGASMSINKQARIRRTCEGTQISFGQAVVIRDERERDDLGGKTGRVKMVPVGVIRKPLDMIPYIADSAHVQEQKNKLEIGSLSELPYWKDDPAWVQEFYNNRRKRERNNS